jgi:MFS family permease
VLTDNPADFTSLANSQECGSSDVQARAAKIQAGRLHFSLPDVHHLIEMSTGVITSMGILSAISTGFWSRLGDTHGRKPILITFMSGALVMFVHPLPSA